MPSLFPKACANCGKVYRSWEEYLALGPPFNGKTRKEYPDCVEHWRNCACGGTMVMEESK